MQLIKVTKSSKCTGGYEAEQVCFSKTELTIGRIRGNEIVNPKGNNSKRHVKVQLKEGKIIVADLKSTNGTYVNGQKISSSTIMQPQDLLFVSDFAFQFSLLSLQEAQAQGIPIVESFTTMGGPLHSRIQLAAQFAKRSDQEQEESVTVGADEDAQKAEGLARAEGLVFRPFSEDLLAQLQGGDLDSITLEHGRVGHPLQQALLETHFLPVFAFDPSIQTSQPPTEDSFAPYTYPIAVKHQSLRESKMAWYHRSFRLKQQVFPGGSLSRWALFQCINQLATEGVSSPTLEVSWSLPEGLSFQELRQSLRALLIASVEARVPISLGRVEVVGRDLLTSLQVEILGHGELTPDAVPSIVTLNRGDQLIITGNVGQHEAAILAPQLSPPYQGVVWSDLFLLRPEIEELQLSKHPVVGYTLPARGGLKAAIREWEWRTRRQIVLLEHHIPISDQVRDVAQRLGHSPLELECAGCLLLATHASYAQTLLADLRQNEWSKEAAIIGEVL